MLFGWRADDPTLLATMAALLTLEALVAIYLPARRTLAIDPIDALRCG